MREPPVCAPMRGKQRRARVPENNRSMNRELHIVGFKIGRETYGVPIASLHEIVRVPEITAVPDAPDDMIGVINLRGRIVSVIDLRKKLGAKEVVSGKGNRILVVDLNGRLCGLMVDSASEVLKVPVDNIEAASSVFQDGGLNCVTGLGKYQGRLIVLLDVNRLLEFNGLRPNAKPEATAQTGNNTEARGAAGAR